MRDHRAIAIATGIGLAGLLVGLWLLVDLRLSSLLAWTERCAPVTRYPALFAGYFATWVALRLARGPRQRRAALLIGSLVCAAIFDPGFLLLSLVWIVVLHRILFGRSPRRVRHAWIFAAVSYLALAVACNRDLFPDLVTARPWLARWGYLFAVGYTFRLAWLLHQVRVQGTRDLPLGDCVTYFVFAPFFLIVPYMLAIPRCDRFCAGLERHDPAIERSGLRLIAWGIALTLAEAALLHYYDPSGQGYAAWVAGDYLAALGHGLLSYPPFGLLHATAIAAILIGLVRVLGIDLGPSFDRPALARSVTDWWRRWNIHFRELLVDIFYYPVLMRNRRRPTRGIVLGCAAVFLVGSALFHLPKTYFTYGRAGALPVGLLVESAIMFVVVAAALVRERRQPDRRPHPLLGPLVTWLVLFVAVAVAGRGAEQAWKRRVLDLPAPIIADTARSPHVFPER